MENLPKDIIEKITNELSPQDFISFDKACNRRSSNDFWLRRIKKDGFDKILSKVDLNKNAKQRYLDLTLRILKRVEKMTSNVLRSFGDFRHFLIPEYKEKVKKLCYEYTIKCLDESINIILNGNPYSLSRMSVKFTYKYFDEYFKQIYPSDMVNDRYVGCIYNGEFNDSLLSDLGFEIKKLR